MKASNKCRLAREGPDYDQSQATALIKTVMTWSSQRWVRTDFVPHASVARSGGNSPRCFSPGMALIIHPGELPGKQMDSNNCAITSFPLEN